MQYTDTQLEEMVQEIDDSGAYLKDWDFDFITGLIDREVKVFSIAQQDQIERIYSECC